MINRGLIYKAIRETYVMTLLFAAGLFVFEMFLALVLPTFFDQAGAQILQLPFVKGLIKGLLGIDVSGGFGGQALTAFAWVHPAVLALIWAFEISVCTRVPAGEAERGTLDMVLAMPVSRTQILLAETLVWIAAGLLLLLCGVLGAWAGSLLGGAMSKPGGMLRILANLFCLYLAVGGLARLCSCAFQRRSVALGLTFALVLGSFFFNFLENFWAPARHFNFLSLLNYYRPLDLIRDQHWPLQSMAILFGFATVALGSAAWLFSRKDVPA